MFSECRKNLTKKGILIFEIKQIHVTILMMVPSAYGLLAIISYIFVDNSNIIYFIFQLEPMSMVKYVLQIKE
jgi:hypothetical protein